jgi:hypothetical protein
MGYCDVVRGCRQVDDLVVGVHSRIPGLQALVNGVQRVVAGHRSAVGSAPDDVAGKTSVLDVGVVTVQPGLELVDRVGDGGLGRTLVLHRDEDVAIHRISTPRGERSVDLHTSSVIEIKFHGVTGPKVRRAGAEGHRNDARKQFASCLTGVRKRCAERRA